MSAWTPTVAIDAGSRLPLFLQIARSVVEDVRRGRLRPGDPLPGSRTLARSLGIHRNTALAAYRELGAEGWIESHPAGATLVSRELPEAAPQRAASPPGALPVRTGFPLAHCVELVHAPEVPVQTPFVSSHV